MKGLFSPAGDHLNCERRVKADAARRNKTGTLSTFKIKVMWVSVTEKQLLRKSQEEIQCPESSYIECVKCKLLFLQF